MPQSQSSSALSIALLGDLAVVRDGQALPLPASKRTRALLGYLVATARAHTRAALCDLLWEGPDDPRAALRWSLTKLRAVVDDVAARRLQADRERVEFDAGGAWVDITQVSRALAGGTAGLSIGELEELARLLRGEFLEGLDLPACWRFHHWCVGERERCGQLRRDVLSALVDRLGQQPQRALPYGRAMVAADPLTESAHATLVRLLGAAGRYPDAEAHYEHARELLRREIALADGGLLDESIRSLRRVVRAAGQAQRDAVGQEAPGERRPSDAPLQGIAYEAPLEAASPAASVPALVGRRDEQRILCDALGTAQPMRGRLLLLTGTPGMGKTRLLDHLSMAAVSAGWQTLRGRCYEAEILRPNGLWLDALRGMGATVDSSGTASPRDDAGSGPIEHAAHLLSGGGGPALANSRAELFDAVVALLLEMARERPLLIALDDLQWLDEGSAALLHYLARRLADCRPPPRVLLAAAARAGETDDNAWAKGLLQSLAREHRLERLTLGPLDAKEAEALLGAEAGPQAALAWRACGGNPLYLLAWARSRPVASAHQPLGARSDLDSLLAEQIDSLDSPTAELLSWAAAMGRDFVPELLGEATGISFADLLARLDRLERRGLLVAAEDGRLDLAHDLLRQAVYKRLSQARRRVIHRRLAQALAEASTAQPQLHGDVSHHASLAGDALLAAQASLAAGEFSLRAFANGEAVTAAERGLGQAQSLEQGPQRVQLSMALLKLRVVAAASPGARRLPSLMEQIQQTVDAAQALSMHAEAASGLHILSWLSQQANDTERTRLATLQAERLARRADEATRCQQLANTGRCLLEVEADQPRARDLIAQAEALAEVLEVQVIELLWGRGLVARIVGEIETARACVARAVLMAGLREDHWREYECRTWLAVIDFERGAFDEVLQQGDQIARIAQRMGDADAPFAQALCALVRLKRCERGASAVAEAEAEMSARVQALREADDQAHLAYVLNAAAADELVAGRHGRAHAFALEALGAARRVRRPSQMVLALAALSKVAAAQGDAVGAREFLAEACRCASEYPTATAQDALAGAQALLGGRR